APLANRLMGRVELTVGPVMGRGNNKTGRGDRADHFAVPGERGVQLDAHLEVDLPVQVDRDVPPGARDLLRADDGPDRTAGVRHDLREFVWSCAPADNRQRPAA